MTWFVIGSFVVWRITSILMYEDMADGFRAWLGIKRDRETGAFSYPENIIGAVFNCFWCLSLVVSFLCIGLAFTGLALFEAVVLWSATSAGAIIIERYFFARYRE